MLMEYPIGDYINTFDYQRGKMGIYNIRYITNKTLLTPILPRKEKGLLKWDLVDSEGWYSSVDIENAIAHGYTFEVIEGIYWEKSAPVFKEYVETFYKMKKDSIKGSCNYATAKLYLNALYGKMLQDSIRTKEKIVSTSEEFSILLQKNKIMSIQEIGDKWLVSYESPQLNKEEFAQKPTHLGVFVLGYSRKIMIEKYNECGNTIQRMPYYYDTDSMVIPSKCLDNVKINEDLGGIMDDVGGKIIKGIFIAPKLYAFKYLSSKDHTLKYHFRGKGVSTKTPEFLTTLKHRGILENNEPNEKLWKDFEDMSKGNSKTFFQNFSIKKIGLTKTTNEKCSFLSHRHIDSEQTKREINKNQWGGRVFINEKNEIDKHGIYSVPFGFELESTVF